MHFAAPICVVLVTCSIDIPLTDSHHAYVMCRLEKRSHRTAKKCNTKHSKQYFARPTIRPHLSVYPHSKFLALIPMFISRESKFSKNVTLAVIHITLNFHLMPSGSHSSISELSNSQLIEMVQRTVGVGFTYRVGLFCLSTRRARTSVVSPAWCSQVPIHNKHMSTS